MPRTKGYSLDFNDMKNLRGALCWEYARVAGSLKPGEYKFAYTSPYDVVLRHGVSFVPTALPTGFEVGEPHQCFMNAYHAVMRHPDLTYVEGFVWDGLRLVHHAWCTDGDRRLYELTLKAPAQEYMGVPFTLKYVKRVMRLCQRFCVIDQWHPKLSWMKKVRTADDLVQTLSHTTKV